MRIFEITKGFQPEGKHSLTDQARRSSRPVCTCEEYEHMLAQLNSMDMKAETFCFAKTK